MISEEESGEQEGESQTSGTPQEIEELLRNLDDLVDEEVTFGGCLIPDYEDSFGKIRPIEMEWKIGKKDSSPSANCFHVPTHHNEFCVEELDPPNNQKSERYMVKSHNDEYFFEPVYNPRDKSIHGRIGLCSQDFFDCIGMISKVTFEVNGKAYVVMGLAHSFSGLYPNFLFRLGDLFPDELREVNEYFDELSVDEEQEQGYNNDQSMDKKKSDSTNQPDQSDSSVIYSEYYQSTNKEQESPQISEKTKSGQVVKNEEEEEECEGEEILEDAEKLLTQRLEKRKHEIIQSYKYFKIDAYTVFGFLLEMFIVKKFFINFLENDRSNVPFNRTFVINWDFVSSLCDEKDDIQMSFVQGNKERDTFKRWIGIQDIVNSLGDTFGDNLDTAFERAYLRLSDQECADRPRCCGVCFSSDVWLDKENTVAIHYKCGDRKKEVSKFRKIESIVYPLFHVSEQYMEDILKRDMDYLKIDNAEEMKRITREAVDGMERDVNRLKEEITEKINGMEKDIRWIKILCFCFVFLMFMFLVLRILEIVL